MSRLISIIIPCHPYSYGNTVVTVIGVMKRMLVSVDNILACVQTSPIKGIGDVCTQANNILDQEHSIISHIRLVP